MKVLRLRPEHRQRQPRLDRVPDHRPLLAAGAADEQHLVAGVGLRAVGPEKVGVGGLQQRLDGTSQSRETGRPRTRSPRTPGRTTRPPPGSTISGWEMTHARPTCPGTG